MERKEDIIRMAREAGWSVWFEEGEQEFLERFAQLVAAAEREECAKVCDEWESDEAFVASIADAIRARGQQT